jgi:hypothetical protein
MKLTKGKISKLYNKKKQSLKKIKKRKGSTKSKTFRRKRQVNLATKSLKSFNYKKLIGGDPLEGDENTPKTGSDIDLNNDINPPSQIGELNNSLGTNTVEKVESQTAMEEPPISQTVTNGISNTVETPPLADSSQTATDGISNTVETPPPVADSSQTATDGISNTVETPPVADSSQTVTNGISNTVETPPPVVDESQTVTNGISDTVETPPPVADSSQTATDGISDNVETPAVVDESQTVTNDISDSVSDNTEAPPESQTATDGISNNVVAPDEVGNVASNSNEQLINLTTPTTDNIQNPELIKSLANVVDYISEKVADKVASQVSQNVSANLNETPQNGFDAVNQAAETMAKLSGGKKRKTKKFKLSNKKNTKRRR